MYKKLFQPLFTNTMSQEKKKIPETSNKVITDTHKKRENETIEEKIEHIIESKSFWSTERILFLANLLIFLFSGIALYFIEVNNPKNAGYNTFMDFLFNSISVGTLTGLFRGDSGFYTFWGQLVLLLNMTISAIVVSFVSVLLIVFIRSGLDKDKSLETEIDRLGLDSESTIKFVFIDILFVWLVGTLLFYFSGTRTVWEAVFNSASHIYNDGVTTFIGNMIPYKNNVMMLFSGGFLITMGGLGIGIRGLVYKFALNRIGLSNLANKIPDSVLAPKKMAFAVVFITLLLQIFGTSFIYSFEKDNVKTFADSSYNSTQLVNSWYMSVSARTAGFTTIGNSMPNDYISADLSNINEKTNYILILLMTVGAASGSFAGGIFKITALLFALSYIISKLKGRSQVGIKNLFTFSEKSSIEANFRVVGFTFTVIVITLILFLGENNIGGTSLLFESISAVSNTGLSKGATGSLGFLSMSLIMFLMIIGKLGFISFVISFFPKLQDLLQSVSVDGDEFPVD
jgi:trk system potassium uptake protein